MKNFFSKKLYSSILEGDINISIEKLVEVLDQIREDGFNVFYTYEMWEECIDGHQFAEWLYDYNTDPQLSDLKKELSIKLDRAQEDEESYGVYLEKLSTQAKKDFSNQFSFIEKEKDNNPYLIYSLRKYMDLRRLYLRTVTNNKDFLSAIDSIYPNIYFHPDLKNKLNTLNSSFSDLLPEIVEHLSALDSYSQNLRSSVEYRISNKEQCKDFSGKYYIACSPERNRDKAKKLTYKDGSISVNCECHTKFEKRGKNRDPKL